MAKVSRSQQRTIADQQIYDNNAKEITPEMVKLVLDAIIDSNYNLVDDELYNQTYQGGQTLEQKLESSGSLPLWGSTGNFDVGSSTSVGNIPGSQGLVGTVTGTREGAHETSLAVTLTQSIAGRKITANVFTSSSNIYNQTGVTLVVKVVDNTNLVLGLRQTLDEVQSVRVEIMAFNIQN